MKKVLLAFLFCLFAIPAFAIAPVESDGTTAILSGAHTIYLDNGTGITGSYSHVIIKLSSGSSSIYITFNQGVTASSSNFLIDSGGTLSYGLAGFSAATNQINYYGNGATGTISWMAW